MAGHSIKYRFNEESGISRMTVPRAIIEAGKLDWKNADELKIVIETINGDKGVFIYKPSENIERKKSPNKIKKS